MLSTIALNVGLQFESLRGHKVQGQQEDENETRCSLLVSTKMSCLLFYTASAKRCRKTKCQEGYLVMLPSEATQVSRMINSVTNVSTI